MTQEASMRIGLLGQGVLWKATQQAIAIDYTPVPLTLDTLRAEGADCYLLIYCDDTWHPQIHQEIHNMARQAGIPWFPVYCEFGLGVIGPCTFPGESGCETCARIRELSASENASETQALWKGVENASLAQPWLNAWSLEFLQQLVIAEIAALKEKPATMHTRNGLLCLQLDTLRIQRHAFLSEPECPDCGLRPADTAEAARISLQSHQKPGPFTYRARSLTEIREQLFATYVDGRMGLVHRLIRPTTSAVAGVMASIGIYHGNGHTSQMSGFGRTLNYSDSRVAGIAEALERYGGQRPKGKRTTVKASYRQLGAQALDPTCLGLYTAGQYAQPDFAYVPYHPDLVFNWVWGYSFRLQRPILLPERYAYYGLSPTDQKDNPAFVYEISNGCALGTCLEEAIFHGILELAERDAFLLTWYARLGVARIDAHSATNPLLQLLLSDLEQTTGYTISLFNMTLNHAIPCIWAMAVDEQQRDDLPRCFCAAGSHPDPEHAALNALTELIPSVERAQNWSAEELARAREMVANSFAVTKMEDHSQLYMAPEAFERLYFLTSSPGRQSFQEIRHQVPVRLEAADLRDDLQTLLDYYRQRGIDVIVVDQTSSEHSVQGLCCVKVVMPGLLPMTFGERFRRVSGFTRLYELPYTLGYHARPLTEADINPYPHPFP